MKVLVVNAGSSSIKYYLYQMPEGSVLSSGCVERIGEATPSLSHFYADTAHRETSQMRQFPELKSEKLGGRKPAMRGM